jgi:hypothetical protein
MLAAAIENSKKHEKEDNVDKRSCATRIHRLI